MEADLSHQSRPKAENIGEYTETLTPNQKSALDTLPQHTLSSPEQQTTMMGIKHHLHMTPQE